MAGYIPGAGFNGAAFFQSGKYGILLGRRYVVTDASMEPLFFKAENQIEALQEVINQVCFNGAAFFQSGKFLSALWCVSWQGWASMEPLFFKAENSTQRTA